MDNQRSMSGNGEDNLGIPDDLRCKRSDGKQWRCTAMSMPDKTVCEKHYIQAKKRAANSAMRASMKKSKRQSFGESDTYLESKSDDMDMPNADLTAEDYPVSASGKKYQEKVIKTQVSYSPETPSARSLSARSSKQNDDMDMQREYEDNSRSFKTPPSVAESSRNRSRKSPDDSAASETSDGSSDSSDDTGGQMCHQCRRNDRDTIIWCRRCNRRGYCDNCISTWYSSIPLEEIARACPACRGNCNCKVCLRADNLIKVKIREIPVQEKLEYLYWLLASVLPVVKRIHKEQCAEVKFERNLQGIDIDLARMKLNADEQMCCDFCKTPIIDYHRHCMECSYDICISCSQDLRESSITKEDTKKLLKFKSNFSEKFSDWIFDSNNGIPCPPKEYGGCGDSFLTLKRIFKMDWVAKLAKNVEEMVNGCKLIDEGKVESDGSFLYCPSCEEIGRVGIGEFRKHWINGEPVIVKEVFDFSSMSMWDPTAIWRGIRETSEEKLKDDNIIIKAMDCLDWAEVDIELSEFIKGYSEGRMHENGCPQMLKLKNWPSPSAFEEFLIYQRPEFINKLPLLEYIHSKWGLLNVAAKLPHYSLQNDAGPKIFISYGTYDELGRGDSVINLHYNTRDMVFLLVHTIQAKPKVIQSENFESTEIPLEKSEAEKSPRDPQTYLDGGDASKLIVEDKIIDDAGSMIIPIVEEKIVNCEDLNSVSEETCEHLNMDKEDVCGNSLKGAVWDVFRRDDVPKLLEYMKVHWNEFEKPDNLSDDYVNYPLFDGVVFLNTNHKEKLEEEYGVKPWCFDQQLGEAVFVPAGCPFQVRNLQSTVQLALDFLSPESLGEAVRLSDEIRSLPNDHNAKVQIMEVGKISLYASSSAIKEVQKLVLDPKLGAELGFEDPNLTAMVSDNLDKLINARDTLAV